MISPGHIPTHASEIENAWAYNTTTTAGKPEVTIRIAGLVYRMSAEAACGLSDELHEAAEAAKVTSEMLGETDG